MVRITGHVKDDHGEGEEITCPKCHGIGVLVTITCPVCNGTGKIRV